MEKAGQAGEKEFEVIRKRGGRYTDKTEFIRRWWDSDDIITLVIDPKQSGKTLMLSTVESFFSLQYTGKSDLFKGLNVWEDECLQNLQGTYPVIRFSFADIDGKDYHSALLTINQVLTRLYSHYAFLLNEEAVDDKEQEFFQSVHKEMDEVTATICLYQLSRYLFYHYQKKSIILFDEYDIPMQKADDYGYDKEMGFFMKTLINASFKTNPYLEKAILTGRKEMGEDSVFSGLNNLTIVTAGTKEYEEYFGCAE